MKEMFKYQVSVIVASYNPDYKKLKKTIVSVLKQKDVSFEVIVTDDGSINNFYQEIEEVFEEYNFKNYTLLSNEKNMGTCSNIYRGIKCAQGEYVKLISPGDYLYSEDTLCLWALFMNENQLDISFGDAVFYQMEGNEIRQIKVRNNPYNRYLYELDSYKEKKIKIDYLVLYDHVVGAAFMMKKEVLERYLEEIQGKVIYAEDFAYRLMILAGHHIIYFPKKVIFYEYGTGISTQKEKIWEERLRRDMDQINNIILSKYVEVDNFSRRYIKLIQTKAKNKVLIEINRVRFFPYYFWLKLRSMICPLYSDTNGDTAFFKECD